MHSNKYFLGLLVFVGLLGLWFSGKAAIELFRFLQTRESVVATILEWKIKERKESDFYIVGNFLFEFKNHTFLGEGAASEKYPNLWSAEKAMVRFSQKKEWKIWFNSRHPEKAIMVRNFPYKSITYALIVLGLMFYFYALGKKAAMFERSG